MQTVIEEENGKGKATATEQGVTAGSMSYNIPNDEFIIIDHTDVNEDFRGKGVGKILLDEIVQMLRSKKMKAIPLCPFANAMFQKHKEIQDVLKA